jgi:hypothetical protein
MTPKEYIRIEAEQQAIIKAAKQKIEEAREEADKTKPPKNRRPAINNDIKEGAIIWHEREKQYGGDYWHIVDYRLHEGDPYKAYVADDGCRYGLAGAYVEIEQYPTSLASSCGPTHV